MSYTIDDLLENTLLRTQDKAAKFTTGKPTNLSVGKDTARGPWAYDLVVSPKPKVKNLLCYHPDMKHHMPVCEEISWDSIGAQVGVTTFDLPLEDKFLLGHYRSVKGSSDGVSWLWPLPAESDVSYMLVYGYEIVGGEAKPFSPGVLDGKELLFSADAVDQQASNEACQCEAPPGSVHDVYVQTTRIVICVSFVCMRKKKNFDPQGALEACRFYPIYEIRSNEDVGQLTASLTYRRPKKSPHAMDDMPPEIFPILFADANGKSGVFPEMPHWDNIFSYYDVGDVGGVTFQAVNSSLKTERTDKTERYHKKWIQGEWVNDVQVTPDTYVDTADTITKKPYQGEFDSVHIAPRMKARGEPVTMAPVCQHDCLHTHWRWGSMFDNKTSLGWTESPSPLPHYDEGAPMVPRNQDVFLTILKDAPGFKYTAVLRKIPFLEIQVVNHHGSAYALDVDSKMLKAWKWTAGGWAEWYRFLRYSPLGDYERVMMRNGARSLDKLRKL